MQINLSGKLAVVTGATGQLGRVMVRTLAACGAEVAIHCLRNRAKADELLAEVQRGGVRGMVVQADVTSFAYSAGHARCHHRRNGESSGNYRE